MDTTDLKKKYFSLSNGKNVMSLFSFVFACLL